MAEPGPRIVSISELRFRPANSNDRARAGMEHAFKDVPDCSFGKDDGISPYMAADAGINDYPDNPASQPPLNGDVPDVAYDAGTPVVSFAHKLMRSGFALSVFLHAIVFCGMGYYATVKLPDDAQLEGESVIAIEFFSETDSEVTTRKQQDESKGKEEAVEEVKEEVKVDPSPEVAKPLEQTKLPEPVEKPVETPQKIEKPVVVGDQPEVLSTTQPSDFQIEAAARQIIADAKIEPLPDTAPPMLVTPVEEKKVEPDKKLVQPLAHPVSKPRVEQKIAEVRPVEKPAETPVVKTEESKKVEPKKEEAKKPAPKPKKEIKKKTTQRDGNAEQDNNKGSSTSKNKTGESQSASQGNSKNRVKGNSSKTNYNGVLVRKLERAKQRVRVAGKGKVIVAFTINANGGVSNLRIVESSGKPAVDKGALDVVRKASPFPPIPAELNASSLTRTVPMTFR